MKETSRENGTDRREEGGGGGTIESFFCRKATAREKRGEEGGKGPGSSQLHIPRTRQAAKRRVLLLHEKTKHPIQTEEWHPREGGGGGVSFLRRSKRRKEKKRRPISIDLPTTTLREDTEE